MGRMGKDMRSKVSILVFFALISGCRNVEGPRYHREHPEQIDNPSYNIDEQKRRGRDLIALPEGSQNYAPKTYIETYGPNGRW